MHTLFMFMLAATADAELRGVPIAGARLNGPGSPPDDGPVEPELGELPDATMPRMPPPTVDRPGQSQRRVGPYPIDRRRPSRQPKAERVAFRKRQRRARKAQRKASR